MYLLNCLVGKISIRWIFVTSCLMLSYFLPAYNQVLPSSDTITDFDISATIRCGKRLYEASIHTPYTPIPDDSDTSTATLNPNGKPVWDSGNNIFGDVFQFQFKYTPSSETVSLEIDFNRDGDYQDEDEFLGFDIEEIHNTSYKYINIYCLGFDERRFLTLNYININGVDFPGVVADDYRYPINLLFEAENGVFDSIQVSGEFSFSQCVTHYKPRFEIQLGSPINISCEEDYDIADLPVLTGECELEVNEIPFASHFCKDTIWASTNSPLYYNQMGSHFIEWNFNSSDTSFFAIQEVQIIDTSPPVFSQDTILPITKTCNAPYPDYPMAEDNCDGAIQASSGNILPNEPGTSYIQIWEYTDASGNTSYQNQLIYTIDNEAPVPSLDSLPNIYAGFISADTSVVLNPSIPTASDNCSEELIMGTTSSNLQFSEVGTYQITWNYADLSGNTSTQLQTVVVQCIEPECAEDINADFLIDAVDFNRIIGKYGTQCFDCCPEDINKDSYINVIDFNRVIGDYGRSCFEF
jgi:hypothetical protein